MRASARPFLVGRNFETKKGAIKVPCPDSRPALRIAQKREPPPNLKEPVFLPGAEENCLQKPAVPPRKPGCLALKLPRAQVRSAGRGPTAGWGEG